MGREQSGCFLYSLNVSPSLLVSFHTKASYTWHQTWQLFCYCLNYLCQYTWHKIWGHPMYLQDTNIKKLYYYSSLKPAAHKKHNLVNKQYNKVYKPNKFVKKLFFYTIIWILTLSLFHTESNGYQWWSLVSKSGIPYHSTLIISHYAWTITIINNHW